MAFGVFGLVVAVYLSMLVLAALWAVVERTRSALERRCRLTHAEPPSAEPEHDGRATGFAAEPLPD